MSSDAKPQFYTFDGSVWSSAPRLAIAELGYDLEKDFDVKTLVLLEGQNFDPSYLKVQPSGTIPTLVDLQGEVLDSTIKVVKYLVANAPKKPASWEPSKPELIEAFHNEKIDPNDSLLGYSINDEQRKAKASDLPGKYWKGRQAALEKYQASAPADLKDFYKKKIEYNNYFVQIYSDDAPAELLTAHYEKAAQIWKDIGAFVNGELTKSLADNKGTFYGGERPGEVDFHAIAWLARTVTAASGSVEGLAKLIGGPVPDNVKAYYETWASRESFKKLGIV